MFNFLCELTNLPQKVEAVISAKPGVCLGVKILLLSVEEDGAEVFSPSNPLPQIHGGEGSDEQKLVLSLSCLNNREEDEPIAVLPLLVTLGLLLMRLRLSHFLNV